MWKWLLFWLSSYGIIYWLTLRLLVENWRPLKSFANNLIQMKPNKTWSFIWDPICLIFRSYISLNVDRNNAFVLLIYLLFYPVCKKNSYACCVAGAIEVDLVLKWLQIQLVWFERPDMKILRKFCLWQRFVDFHAVFYFSSTVYTCT